MSSPFIEATRGSPANQITVWSGLLSDIPDGWVLCDGNNGTPDLRGKFLKGVPGSTNPGGVGGTDSVTLSTSQLPSHNHSASTDTVGGHTHSWESASNAIDTSNSYYRGLDPTNTGSETMDTSTNGGHSHSISTGGTGSGGSIENRPPYYEVAYILKL